MIHSIILLSMLLAQSVLQILCQGFDSPCPTIFQYQVDSNSNQIYGVVQVTGTNSNLMLLNVELSVGNPVRGYNGMIELAKPKKEVINDVIYQRPILYKVYFPVWHRMPPRVTKILVNGNLICSGPKISGTPVVTTISLQHTLKVDYQPLSYPANTNVDNYIITPGDIRDNPFIGNGRPPRPPPDGRRPPPNGRRPPTPPPDGRPPPEYAPQYGNEQYGFNSDSYEGGSNVNSKPQESKDPSTVYNGNPFFSSSTSKPLANFPGGETIPARESVIQDNRNTVSKNIRSGIPYQAICGRPVATNSLVFHGQAVPIGAYPWLAALFRVKATGLNYMCSASLISDKHVVTAAHCVKQENKKLRPDDLLIILGKLNIQKWSQGDGEKMLDPESIHIHPDYQALSSDADIAVIILKESLEFTKLIRPICLWGMESSDLQNVVGKEGTVVGWGKDENGDLITAEPKQIALPIVSQETCLRSSYTFADITSNRTFCAGYRDGTGPCNGDSGSGFILKRGDRWMLRGIVSMSISDTQKFTCDLKNYVVFTDASKFLPWLMSFLT